MQLQDHMQSGLQALAHLNLYGNDTEAGGVERFAGVMGQCPALAHLNFGGNDMT